MAIYLLDFENVHDSGIAGVTSLTEKDELYIFYSVKSEHMSFETHVNIMKSSCQVRYIKLRRAAKNYLDFQLCTHLGYIIGAGFEGPFYIISKDTGYDSAIDYWKDHGVTIIRQPSIGFNRNLGKSTGQNPAHNTPPALVTFRQGGQVTNPDVSELYRMDTGKPSSDVDNDTLSAVTKEPSENAVILDMPAEGTIVEDDGVSAVPEETPAEDTKTSEDSAQTTAVSEESSSKTTSGGRSTQKSRSRKSSSKKTAAQSQSTDEANKETSPAAETAEPAAVEENIVPEENTEQVTIKPDSLPESYRKRVRTALKGKNIPSAYYASIYKAILNSYDKLALNNLLVKTFGSSRGGEVYKLIKDIFIDFQS